MNETDGVRKPRPETIAKLDEVLARIADGAFPIPPGLSLGLLGTATTRSRIGDSFAITLIQRAVADDFRVPVERLTSRRRTEDVVVPRQLAMYLARRLTKASFPRIGRAFGRDHTTVLHACRRVEASLRTDPRLAAAIAGFIERFQMEYGTKPGDGDRSAARPQAVVRHS